MKFCPYFLHLSNYFEKKCGAKNLRMMPLRNCEFRENRCITRRILLKIVNEIGPYFLHFSSDVGNVRYTGYSQTFEFSSVKIDTVKTILYVGALVNICPYFPQLFPMLLKFGIRDPHIPLLSMC